MKQQEQPSSHSGQAGWIEFFALDVAKESDAWKLKEHLLRAQGIEAPDLLVNNAGICLKDEKQCDKVYLKSLEVNSWGPIRLAELWLPEMMKQR